MTRCTWAGCSRPAPFHDSGWDFCREHLAEHNALMAEDRQAERERTRHHIRSRVAELHPLGLSDREMATRIGCDRVTIRWHRNALDLPLNTPPNPRQPHGTHAAFVRHKRHSETPCEACVAAEREYQRDRARNRRRAA